MPEPKTFKKECSFAFFWEVKCAETECQDLYFPDKLAILFSNTFLELVSYICLNCRSKQELILKQRNRVLERLLTTDSNHSDDSEQFQRIPINSSNAMNKNTIDDYKKGVKYKYDEVKTGEFSGFLLNPSPAELKNLCLLQFDKGCNKLDQEILDRFFELDDKSSKRKQIEYFEVDKLKPISNFLRGKTLTTRAVNLDLMAVLVDFNPRPYRKFMLENKEKLTVSNPINNSLNKEEKGVEKVENIFEEFKNRRVSKRIAFAVMTLFVFGAVGYGVKNIFFPDKNCMVWVKNHYEAVEYDKVKDTAEVSPLNQGVLDNFKKITVCDTTTFFKNGDTDHPLVWYGKSTDKKEYEYFNQPGLHPETGKTLKPISKYIIGKYILKK